MLHDFPVAALRSNTRAEEKHLSTSSSLFKSWTYICWTEVNEKCYKHPATHNSSSSQCSDGNIKGKSKETTLIPENKAQRPVHSVGASSNSSRTAELFVLSNILLQVKLLQKNRTYKDISCLLKVHPVLRVVARTFRCQVAKGKLVLIAFNTKTSTFSKSHWNAARVTKARSGLSTKGI